MVTKKPITRLTPQQNLMAAGGVLVGGWILTSIGNSMTNALNSMRFGCGAQSLFTGSQSSDCFWGTNILPFGQFLSGIGSLAIVGALIFGGLTLYIMHKSYSAMNSLNLAIEEDPGNPEAYNNRAHAYRLRKEYDRALNDFSKAIELDENHVAARFGRASIYITKKDWDNALEDLNKILTHNPHNAVAYNARGAVLENKHDFEKALPDYERAAALEPASLLYKQNLAKLKAKIDIDKADARVGKDS